MGRGAAVTRRVRAWGPPFFTGCAEGETRHGRTGKTVCLLRTLQVAFLHGSSPPSSKMGGRGAATAPEAPRENPFLFGLGAGICQWPASAE